MSDRATNLFGALVLVASDAMREVTDVAANLGSAAPAALVALFEAPRGRSVDELGRVVGLTPSGAVRLVDRLAAEGYVQRRAGADRRSVSVVLSASGRRRARKVIAARADALERMLDPLAPEQRAALTGMMETLLGAATLRRLASREMGRPPAGGWTCRLCDFAACGRDRGLCPVANAAAPPAG